MVLRGRDVSLNVNNHRCPDHAAMLFWGLPASRNSRAPSSRLLSVARVGERQSAHAAPGRLHNADRSPRYATSTSMLLFHASSLTILKVRTCPTCNGSVF